LISSRESDAGACAKNLARLALAETIQLVFMSSSLNHW